MENTSLISGLVFQLVERYNHISSVCGEIRG